MNYTIGNMQFDSNYLEHHGILGMKWGQRNGPPYPLDASDKSAAEKKATRVKEYTAAQRERDRKLYGKNAVRRIEKRMLKGEGLQSARHNEVVLKDRKEKVKNIALGIGKSAFVLIGSAYVTKWLSNNSNLFSNIDTYSLNDEVMKNGKRIINAFF